MPNSSPSSRPESILVADKTLSVGVPATLLGESPCSAFAALFEDDGETGYFYGLDRSLPDQPILDALHIYNVQQVSDRAKPSRFQIVWSADGLRVLLLINNYPHAAFDFEVRQGYCRNNFPPPNPGFTQHDHAWSDEVLKLFR